MKHLIAFSEAVDNVSDYEINAIADTVISTSTPERVIIPANLNIIDWVYHLGVSNHKTRIFTPSLERRRIIGHILPYETGLTPSIVDNKVCLIWRGLKLDSSEDLSVRVTYPDVAFGERVVTLISLDSGERSEIPAGEERIVRMTASDTLTPYTWSLVKPIPDVQLEAGTYAITGFIPYSAGCIGARVIVQGNVYRPGVLGVNGTSENSALTFTNDYLSYHQPYVMGVFDHRSIPQFEFLSSSTDNSEVVYVRIKKIG